MYTELNFTTYFMYKVKTLHKKRVHRDKITGIRTTPKTLKINETE